MYIKTITIIEIVLEYEIPSEAFSDMKLYKIGSKMLCILILENKGFMIFDISNPN